MKLVLKVTVEYDEDILDEGEMAFAVDQELDGIYDIPGVSKVHVDELTSRA